MRDEFGKKMHIAAFAIKGDVSEADVIRLTDAIIARIGMTKAHSPAVFDYPFQDKGGTGFTYCQPITESAILWDTWPDHEGAYLMIHACKDFNAQDVMEEIDKTHHASQAYFTVLTL